MQIIRYRSNTGDIALGLLQSNQFSMLPDRYPTLHDLLQLKLDDLHAVIDATAHTLQPDAAPAHILAPIDGDTEVWAAGVTYKRSEEARTEESDTPDVYSRVYRAQRPELFFKATPRRVSGPGIPIVVRADSTWDVPEPELVLVINAHAGIIGYTIGNDVSSRSIEGENPLYLPQAKVYTGCCALGPAITPVWEIADPYNLAISMTIERDGQTCWQGETNTRELHRRLDELVAYLFQEDDFPHGVLLSTGTALVPDRQFTLLPADIVHISIQGLGTLHNPVVRGKAQLHQVSTLPQ